MFDIHDAAWVPKGFGFFEDFHGTATAATLGSGPLTHSIIAAGTFSGIIGGNAALGVPGGWARIINDGTSADSGGQLLSAGSFCITPYKPIAFKCRVDLSGTTNTAAAAGELIMGLVSGGDTSLIGSSDEAFADGVYFHHQETSSQIHCSYQVGGTEVEYALPLTVFTFDANAHTYGISIRPGAAVTDCTVDWIIDGKVVYSRSGLTLPATATDLAAGVAWTAGIAEAQQCDIDYVSCYQRR